MMAVFAAFQLVGEELSLITNSTQFAMITMARAVVAAIWSLAVWRIWKVRHSPLANQAMTASLALVATEFLLIYHEHFAPEVLAFFIGAAQVSIAIALMRIFHWVGKHRLAIEYITAKGLVSLDDGNTLTTLAGAFLTIMSVGVVYFLLALLEGALL